MNKPATIKDIARHLNISASTVSRALRNASDVNMDTKNAVMALSEDLNYQPNRLALSLQQTTNSYDWCHCAKPGSCVIHYGKRH